MSSVSSTRARLLPRRLPAAGRTCVLAFAAGALACGGSDLPDPDAPGNTTAVGQALVNSFQADPTPLAEQAQASVAPQQQVQGELTMDLSQLGYNTGSREAPIKIVEFSDFGCGYCRKFHVEDFYTLKEEYMDTGKVEWKYVPMTIGLFGPSATLAAEAAECALEQDRFPEARDRLFESQSDWKGASDARPILRRLMEEEDLDMARWDECIASGERTERIRQGTLLAQQAGVRGTPTFIVLEYAGIPGALPLDLFRQVIDTVYADHMARREAAGR
jgi:protein-disulfide isomerase